MLWIAALGPRIGEQKDKVHEKTGDMYQRLSMKIDRLSDIMDENSRLLKQVEAQMKENKHAGAIDLTPWLVSTFVFFSLVYLLMKNNSMTDFKKRTTT
ncbi:hypothetical protein PVAP13_6NG371700 [Panicum virgatum]|uniref:Uncharacterized protein n=1 Tax=Panicum virgatum TaxID=38727 RepID=A0A8T0R5B7_PANVG|nr:hypothetical protein PVAP13_6NG371700 [Panicum virgatum]